MAAPEVADVERGLGERRVPDSGAPTGVARGHGQRSVPERVEGEPVEGSSAQRPPVVVTKAGSAADRADFSQLVDVSVQPRRLEFVDRRSSVVLYVADSEVQPTRECVDTVAAIARATGRIAVGLIGNGDYAQAWRQEIDGAIPMGALDERMARTLVLLAEGPPRNFGEGPSSRRARYARAQLAQERSRAAGAAARLQRKLQVAAESAVWEALQELAEQEAADAESLRSRAESAAARLKQWCGDELGLDVDTAVPAPERPARPNYVVEAVVAVASLGVAVAAVRVVHRLLTWVGLPPAVAVGAALVVGLIVAVVAVGATVRRNAKQRSAQWRANYLAHLRRRWQQAVEVAVREALGARGQGWRIEQLANYVGPTNR